MGTQARQSFSGTIRGQTREMTLVFAQKICARNYAYDNDLFIIHHNSSSTGDAGSASPESIKS
jgi:hypothetical protein